MHFHVYLRLSTSETVTWIAASINYIYTIPCEKLRLEWNILADIQTNPLSTNPWINVASEMHYKFYGKKKQYQAIYIKHNTFPYLQNRINSKTYKNIYLLLLDIKHYSREKLLLNESYTANNSGASHMTNLVYKFTIDVVLVAV